MATGLRTETVKFDLNVWCKKTPDTILCVDWGGYFSTIVSELAVIILLNLKCSKFLIYNKIRIFRRDRGCYSTFSPWSSNPFFMCAWLNYFLKFYSCHKLLYFVLFTSKFPFSDVYIFCTLFSDENRRDIHDMLNGTVIRFENTAVVKILRDCKTFTMR